MPLELFSISKLDLIDGGKVVAAIDAEIQSLSKDCIDRPLDDGDRVLTLKIRLTPRVDIKAGQRECTEVNVAFDLDNKIPTRKSAEYEMAVRSTGTMVFNPASPSDLRQEPLFVEPIDPEAEKLRAANQRKREAELALERQQKNV